MAELVKEDWAEVGIFANVVEQERSLVEQRRAANELQIFVWQNDGTDELFLYPYHAIPVNETSGTGPGYGIWYSTGGASGIEPTDNVKAVLADIIGHGNEQCMLPGQLEAEAAARSEKAGGLLFSKAEVEALNEIAHEAGLQVLDLSTLATA